MKVYVSSTYSDLVDYRTAVYDALRRLRYDVLAMEDYVATDQRPLEKCVEDVASCDTYVGIIAWRYGFVPPEQERSITELEYEAAGTNDVPQFVFLAQEGAEWPSEFKEEGSGRARLEDFRRRLGGAHIVNFFSNPDELAMQVVLGSLQDPVENERQRGRADEYVLELAQSPARGEVSVCVPEV